MTMTTASDYKAAIVTEYDGCATTGDKGAMLRREGLYSSHISERRKASNTGALAGLDKPPRSGSRRTANGAHRAMAPA